MGFIKRFFLKRMLKSASAKAKTEADLYDDILKSEFAELQKIRANAKKLLQAKLVRQESRKTLEDIRELDEDEEEEEVEEAPDFQDKITEALISKFLGGSIGSNPAGDNPQAEELQKIAAGLTPEQIQALKEKFL